MPTNSFCNRSTFSKSIKLTILSLLLPLVFYAQSLTGLWIGSLGNDSTTVRKDQSFEIALTEYKGKVYGYSRSEFIVDDVLYYIVKRVKGTIEGDVCEVTDDEIIAFNFPKKLDKNIKVTSTFRKDKGDSLWHMDGKWKTNATKKYYSVTGKVELESEKDLTASKIFPHLEELKLAEDVAFYKDRKEGQPIVRIAKPEKAEPELTAKAEKILADKDVVTTNAVVKTAVKDPASNPVKPTLTTADGKAAAQETTANNSKNNSNPALSLIEEGKEPANAEMKNVAADKKIEETLVAKNNLPANNKQQASTSSATKQQDKINETKTEEIVKNNPVTEQKEVAKQDVATIKNQPLTASEKQTEIIASNADNKTVTNSTASNIKPEPANNGNAVKNNTTVEKKEPVKQDVALVKNQNQSTSVKQTETVATKPDNKTATNTTASNTKPETTSNINIVKNNTTPEKKETIKQDVAVVKNQNSSAAVKQTETVVTKPDNKTVTNATVLNIKPETTNTGSVAKTTPVVEQKEKVIIPIAPEVKKPDADITLKAAMIAGRKSEFSQVVNFKSDSLQISLYDNGEIDGDTVSVFMNGEVILAQQGLKSSAIKKTIYLTPGQNDEFTLVMFAESLGKYPPNTGLLVIRDGDDIYNLRFSSDFQKNAGIVFRRKK